MKSFTVLLLAFISIAGFQKATADTLTNGLVAYYPFCGDFKDYSTNRNNLTNLTAGITLGTDRFGGTNSSLHISSSSDSANSINPIGISGTNYRSASFWLKLDNNNINNNNSLLFSFGNINSIGSYFGVVANHNAGGDLCIWGSYADLRLDGLGFPFANNWHQVIITYNGSIKASKVYIDGTLFTTALPDSLNQTNVYKTANTQIYIGYNPNNPAGGGKEGASISDLRIYNRALSTSEVTQLYGQERTMPVLVYTLKATRNLATNSTLQISTNTGFFLANQYNNSSSFIWLGGASNSPTYSVENHSDIDFHPTSRSIGGTALFSLAVTNGLFPNLEKDFIWISGTNSLNTFNSNHLGIAPASMNGILNTLTLQGGTTIQSINATLTLDKTNTLIAITNNEGVSDTLARLTNALNLKGFSPIQ